MSTHFVMGSGNATSISEAGALSELADLAVLIAQPAGSLWLSVAFRWNDMARQEERLSRDLA
ncbi:MAG: hypothetical protein WBM08_10815 [Prochlorococcaceae cyanobacterium]